MGRAGRGKGSSDIASTIQIVQIVQIAKSDRYSPRYGQTINNAPAKDVSLPKKN